MEERLFTGAGPLGFRTSWESRFLLREETGPPREPPSLEEVSPVSLLMDDILVGVEEQGVRGITID